MHPIQKALYKKEGSKDFCSTVLQVARVRKAVYEGGTHPGEKTTGRSARGIGEVKRSKLNAGNGEG